MIQALKNGVIAAAGIDVFDNLDSWIESRRISCFSKFLQSEISHVLANMGDFFAFFVLLRNLSVLYCIRVIMPKRYKGGGTLLNESKIKVMTHLARREKAENGNDFRIMNFYKYDYIRYNLLKTFLNVTIGYGLILVLIALYKAEYLIANLVLLDYKAIGAVILAIYILLLIVYSVATVFTCSQQYDKSRKRVGRYYKILDVLRKFYNKESEQK